jgi:hypothetical protein
MKRTVPALAAAALLAGCVLVPRTVHTYDPGCRVTVRTMELQAVQIAWFNGCSNEGCGVLLAAAGATAAASAVISGSIMVVGNVVYWLERQGTCLRPG